MESFIFIFGLHCIAVLFTQMTSASVSALQEYYFFTVNCENKVAFILSLNFDFLMETFNDIESVKVRQF